MPDKSSTVVSYAAGASLAAVALIYVFGPNFTLDSESGGSKKKTVVGLRNQANDCFINSILQVLAGLGELRIYLIQETHRRRIEDPAVYANLVQPEGRGKELALWKLQGLQEGLVTNGLKEMLDALNERPIVKKAISPFPFVKALEAAFRQRISRQQQDAQEFLQIVAERLKDEYHAGQRARLAARTGGMMATMAAAELHKVVNSDRTPSPAHARGVSEDDGRETHYLKSPLGISVEGSDDVDIANTLEPPADIQLPPPEIEEGFPMEGKYESQIQCMTCRYKYKPREETFCTMTLAVPQVTSTTLNKCFDGIFKSELIEDFKCDYCRLQQAKVRLEHDIERSPSESWKQTASESLQRIEEALVSNPENPPPDLDLGDPRDAPARTISRTTRMTIFPRVLALHLSRSIYGVGQATQKNSAKVAFPEQLALGGLADQRKYRLLGVVTHRGGHNSGHYEAFRRQNLPVPFHNTNTFQPSEIYSKTPTPISTPLMAARNMDSPTISTPDLLDTGSVSSTPSLESMAIPPPPRSVPADLIKEKLYKSTQDKDPEETGSLRSVAASTKSAISRLASPRLSSSDFRPSSSRSPQQSIAKKTMKRRKLADKWWRVSDEKVKEAKTSELLGMQREVYLLFYELEKD